MLVGLLQIHTKGESDDYIQTSMSARPMKLDTVIHVTGDADQLLKFKMTKPEQLAADLLAAAACLLWPLAVALYLMAAAQMAHLVGWPHLVAAAASSADAAAAEAAAGQLSDSYKIAAADLGASLPAGPPGVHAVELATERVS